jgi:hypothetical protein
VAVGSASTVADTAWYLKSFTLVYMHARRYVCMPARPSSKPLVEEEHARGVGAVELRLEVARRERRFDGVERERGRHSVAQRTPLRGEQHRQPRRGRALA